MCYIYSIREVKHFEQNQTWFYTSRINDRDDLARYLDVSWMGRLWTDAAKCT